MSFSKSLWWFVLITVFSIGGCDGAEPVASGDAEAEGVDPSPDGEPSAPLPDRPREPCVELPCAGSDGPVVPSATPRFARLTHTQYENTVRDLFGMEALPNIASTFIPDPTPTRIFTVADALEISPELWTDYQRGAEEVAARVAANPALVAALVPGNLSPDPDERKARFLSAFLARAFRRPLTSADLSRYGDLYDRGAELLVSEDRFLAGVEIVVRAALQSPHFLFRVESSQALTEGGLVVLSGHEVASRLSYALWNSMPSEALFEAAAGGELSSVEGLERHISTMLGDPLARARVRDFHRDLLRTNVYADILKNPDRFEYFGPDTGLFMQIEVDLFVESIVFDQGLGFRDLLTSPRTFVNQNLALIYGLEGDFGGDFVPVELRNDERAGLLTRLGFLASNANSLEHDPIHRGVFVSDNILCLDLPAPPDNVPPLPSGQGVTMRQRVEAHTGEGTCGQGCHSVLINPPGFAFEHYDALGQFRLKELGHAVDATGAMAIDDEAQSFDGAVAFSALLADSFKANACYTRHWLEALYGRTATRADNALIAPVAEASRRGTFTIIDLVKALLLSDAFLKRAPEEVSP